MHASVRRYEGIDKVRSEDVTRKVGQSPVLGLRKVPGFSGCYVFAGEHDPETDTNRLGRLS